MALPVRRPRPASPGPGALDRLTEEMIRVDQAGEFGAVQIYRGQKAVFDRLPGARRMSAILAAQEADEAAHLKAFNALVARRGVRPTLFSPLWGAAGYALGVATALLGEKAAHACTAAVETVIEEHYAAQERTLGDRDPELRGMIEQFRAEETAHKDQAIAEGAHDAPAWPALEAVIKAGCRVAIAVSQKI